MEPQGKNLILDDLPDVIQHKASDFVDFLEKLGSNKQHLVLNEVLEKLDVALKVVAFKKEDNGSKGDTQ